MWLLLVWLLLMWLLLMWLLLLRQRSWVGAVLWAVGLRRWRG